MSTSIHRDGPPFRYSGSRTSGSLSPSLLPIYSQNLIAGSIAGLSGCVIGHPFDTLRVRLQNSGLFNSATDCFLKTIHTEGAAGLYKGILPPLLATTFLKASMFASHTFLIQLQTTNPSEASLLNHFISGLGVGIINSLLSTPIDRAKILLQVQDIKNPVKSNSISINNHSNYHHRNYFHKNILLQLFTSSSLVSRPSSSPFTGVTDIFKKIGFFGMYQGLTPSIGREMIGASTYFTVYEILTRIRKNMVDLDAQTQAFKICSSLVIGGLNGAIMWTVMLPIDIIKSRVQAEVSEKRGTMEIIKQVHKEGGIQAFYRGWRPSIARAVPAHAAVIGTYELVMRLFSML